jgi:hypothetical protein
VNRGAVLARLDFQEPWSWRGIQKRTSLSDKVQDVMAVAFSFLILRCISHRDDFKCEF